MVKNICVQEMINNDLIKSGYLPEDLTRLRISADKKYIIKNGKKGFSAKNSDLSFIQYKDKFFLIYVIEADIMDTNRNAFISGNCVVAIGKKCYRENEIHDILNKQQLAEDFFAPFIFPRSIWTKGYISSEKNNTTINFRDISFIMRSMNRIFDPLGNEIRERNKKLTLGEYTLYTEDGLSVLLEYISHIKLHQ